MHNSLNIDLTLIVVFAAIATWLCIKVRLPQLLGFITVGIILGPITNILGQTETITHLGEFGIVFMMFFLGMEFNLDKLKKVFAPSVGATTLQCILMMALGIISARMIGFSEMTGLFLGGILCLSSTIIFMDYVESKGELNAPYSHLGIGMLIIDDIFAVTMIVVLSAIGTRGEVHIGDIWQTIFLLLTFVVALFVVGKIALPPILKKVSLSTNSQAVMLFILAIIFGLSEAANHMNFSVEIGAFLAGSILAGTPLALQIEKITNPFRQFFVAIFFVSIGTMINPLDMLNLWLPILLISLAVIFGQALTCIIGAFVFGASLHDSFLASLHKARISELSFVVAALGISLNAVDTELSSLVMGIAFVTIFLNPIFASQIPNIEKFSKKYSPKFLKECVVIYQNFLLAAKINLNKNSFFKLTKKPIIQITIYFLLCNAVVVIASIVSELEIVRNFEYIKILYAVIWIITGIAVLPSLIGIWNNVDKVMMHLTNLIFKSDSSSAILKNRTRKIFQFLIGASFFLFISAIYYFVAKEYLPLASTMVFFCLIVFVVAMIFKRRFAILHSKLAYAFTENFTEHLQNDEHYRRESIVKNIKEKYPWSIDICAMTIAQNHSARGKTIAELKLRNLTGASINAIEREHFTSYNPSPDTILFPGDTLILLGTPEQNNAACKLLSTIEVKARDTRMDSKFVIEYVLIENGCPFINQTLKELTLNRIYNISIVGIQRGDEKVNSPGGHDVILNNDILIVAGKENFIEDFIISAKGK